MSIKLSILLLVLLNPLLAKQIKDSFDIKELTHQHKSIDSFIIKTKNKGFSQEVERVGFGDVKRTLFLDGLGRAIKYVRQGGSEDSGYKMSYYYSNAGKLFYLLVEAEAVSGAKYQVKIAFDSTGKRLSEVSKFLTDPATQGWAFPKPWPQELMVFDPLSHFKARSWRTIKTSALKGNLIARPGEYDLNLPVVISNHKVFAKRVNDAIFESLIGSNAPPEYSAQLSPKHILASECVSCLARKITYEVVVNNPQILSLRFSIETVKGDLYIQYMNFNSTSGELLGLDQIFDAHYTEMVYTKVQTAKLAVYSVEDQNVCPEFLSPFSEEQLTLVQNIPFLVTDTNIEFLVSSCERRFGPADFTVKISFDSIPWR